MNPWVRALLGVLIGSALTLVIHPRSRQYLLGALSLASPNSVAGLANLHPTQLPPPSTPVDAAYWLQLASEKSLAGNQLSTGELKTLIQIGEEGRKLDRENAFWNQMLAAFYSKRGMRSKSLEQWSVASKCQTWNDLQTQRLLQDRSRLAERGDFNQAWTYGYVYFARSDAPAQFIESYAKELIASSTIDDLDGLKLRFQTVRNGALIRDGSRSLRIGHFGAEVVEAATYPPSLSELKGFKRLWIAQTTTVARLRQFGLDDDAKIADESFKRNEAWLVHSRSQDPDENVRNLCLIAIALSALPGSLLLCSVLGFMCVVVVRLANKRLNEAESFSVVKNGIAAMLTTILGVLFTHLWLVSLTLGASIAFLAVNPRAARKLRLKRLGPLYTLTIASVWLVACSALTIFFVSKSTAALSLLPLLGPSGDYFTDSELFLGVAMAMVALLCLASAAWALVQRQKTPSVFAATAERFTILMGVGSLTLCAFAGPLTVYADRKVSAELEKIVANEPNYYQRQPF
jgi:hypothetical protein